MCLSGIWTCAQVTEKSPRIIQNKIKFNLSDKDCRFLHTTQNHKDMYLFYFLRIVIIKLEWCMFRICSIFCLGSSCILRQSPLNTGIQQLTSWIMYLKYLKWLGIWLWSVHEYIFWTLFFALAFLLLNIL